MMDYGPRGRRRRWADDAEKQRAYRDRKRLREVRGELVIAERALARAEEPADRLATVLSRWLTDCRVRGLLPRGGAAALGMTVDELLHVASAVELECRQARARLAALRSEIRRLESPGGA